MQGLFGEIPERQDGRAPAANGRAAQTVRLHSVRLEHPNPLGRVTLKFEYRLRCRWPAELAAAAELAVETYFGEIGGFRVADDAIMAAAVAGVTLFTDEQVGWAIAAKAASLAGLPTEEARRYRGRPERFFAEQLAGWLQRSPEYRRQREASLAAERERQVSSLVDELYRRRAGARCAPAAECAAVSRFNEAAADRRRAAELLYWQGLSPGQRQASQAAVARLWRVVVESWGIPASDPVLAELHLAWCVDWARRQWSDSHSPSVKKSPLFPVDEAPSLAPLGRDSGRPRDRRAGWASAS